MMDDIRALLLDQEGMRLRPYDDATGKELHAGDRLIGKLTIGIGRNLTDVDLSPEEVDLLFARDLAVAERDVRYLCPVFEHLSRARQLVLLSMAFNLGRSRMAGFKRFLAAVEIGDYEEAADQLLDSKAAKHDAPARYQQLAFMMRHDRMG